MLRDDGELVVRDARDLDAPGGEYDNAVLLEEGHAGLEVKSWREQDYPGREYDNARLIQGALARQL